MLITWMGYMPPRFCINTRCGQPRITIEYFLLEPKPSHSAFNPLHASSFIINMTDTGRQSATDKFTAAMKVDLYFLAPKVLCLMNYSPTPRSRPRSTWVTCSKAKPTTLALLLSLRLVLFPSWLSLYDILSCFPLE